MDGFGSHTFQWVNARSEVFWVKYHVKTDQGIKNLIPENAARIAGNDADYHQRDLLRAIDRAEYPSWTLKMQIMPAAEAVKCRFNPFDVTKVWPHRDYPLTTVGRIVLNRNPENYFAEVEQAAFNPAPSCRASVPPPTRCCKAACSPTAILIDTGLAQITCICRSIGLMSPRSTTTAATARCTLTTITVARRTTSPTASTVQKQTGLPLWAPIEVAGLTGNHAPMHHRDVNDFVQAGDLYRLMSDEKKQRLIANIAASLSKVSREDIIERSVGYFRKADPEYGNQVARAVAKHRMLR